MCAEHLAQMVTYAEFMRFCTSRDGTRIAYAVSGNGPPIIRLAGLFTHLEFDRESSIWRPWLSALEKGRLLIRYDARGSGMSDSDGVKFSFEHYIEDLEAVATATGLHKFALFGIGGPAALAVAYAARHPEQVTHLILHAAFTQGRLARATTAGRSGKKSSSFSSSCLWDSVMRIRAGARWWPANSCRTGRPNN